MRGCWLVMVACMVACGPVLDGVGTDGATSTDSDDGTDTTTGGTSPTTTVADTTTASTTTSTTASTTGTPPACDGEFVSGCQSYCAASITCNPSMGVYEDCVNDCIASLEDLGTDCQTQFCLVYACFGALDCDTLAAGSPECDALAVEAFELCDEGSDCIFGGGSNGSCEHSCEVQGVEQRLACDVELCTCFVNGEAIASCPANGLCNDLDALDDYEASCCGW